MPRPWSERVPDDEHQERRDYLAPVARAMDDRTRRLGEFTAEAAPAWAERAFGPVPDDPEQRQSWQERAAAVASYREMFGYNDPAEPIGPEPINSPEARQHWHAAFAALGPVDGQDLRGLSDGQLLNRRNSYESETAWAPRWVGDELRQVRMGADTAERDAVLSAARAEAARKQEQHEQAETNETMAGSQRALAEHYRRMESDFAKTMETRQAWEETTRQARHDALAANSEYLRRHPDTDLPPMKSAEPPRPAGKSAHRSTYPSRGSRRRGSPTWPIATAQPRRKSPTGRASAYLTKITSGKDSKPGQAASPCTVTPYCSRHPRKSSRPRKSPSVPPRSTGKLENDRDGGDHVEGVSASGRKVRPVASVDFRDCECNKETSHMDLQHILLMFRCAECRDVQGSLILDLDKAIDVLTKLRAVQIDGGQQLPGLPELTARTQPPRRRTDEDTGTTVTMTEVYGDEGFRPFG